MSQLIDHIITAFRCPSCGDVLVFEVLTGLYGCLTCGYTENGIE